MPNPSTIEADGWHDGPAPAADEHGLVKAGVSFERSRHGAGARQRGDSLPATCAECARLRNSVSLQIEVNLELVRQLAEQKALNLNLADRLAAASECLGRAAERGKVV